MRPTLKEQVKRTDPLTLKAARINFYPYTVLRGTPKYNLLEARSVNANDTSRVNLIFRCSASYGPVPLF
jgi:hypothetical protein